MELTCTLVTCYYKFPSKHSFQKYDEWMANFLQNVATPIVIFCEQEYVSKFTELRRAFMEMTEIVVMPWENMMCASKEYAEYWNKDYRRDPERHIHNPRLYTVWNEKTSMVHKAMQMNCFNTEFYCWCDIGCFRSKEDVQLFESWPSGDFLKCAKRDRMYLLNIEPFCHGETDILSNGLTHPFVGKNRIGGTIFLGHCSVWPLWFHAYYTTLQLYLKNDYFSGKDQNIMGTVVAKFPDLVQLVRPTGKAEDGDPWFYLQRYFLKSEL